MATSEDSGRAFRRAMGAFATGVTVVSAAKADGRISGITVNSLTSVSLEPPLMLWCLGNQSERYDVFAEADNWGVTILGAHEENLARRFAQAEFETIAPPEADWLADAPILRAGVATFACRTLARHEAGDHLVIVGEVLEHRVSGGEGLIFVNGRYGQARMEST